MKNTGHHIRGMRLGTGSRRAGAHPQEPKAQDPVDIRGGGPRHHRLALRGDSLAASAAPRRGGGLPRALRYRAGGTRLLPSRAPAPQRVFVELADRATRLERAQRRTRRAQRQGAGQRAAHRGQRCRDARSAWEERRDRHGFDLRHPRRAHEGNARGEGPVRRAGLG